MSDIEEYGYENGYENEYNEYNEENGNNEFEGYEVEEPDFRDEFAVFQRTSILPNQTGKLVDQYGKVIKITQDSLEKFDNILSILVYDW